MKHKKTIALLIATTLLINYFCIECALEAPIIYPSGKPKQDRDLDKFPLASMYYADMYKKSGETRKKLIKIALEIAKQFEGAQVVVPPLKSFGRTIAKVNEYHGDFKKVLDFLRGSILFQSVDDIYKALKIFPKTLQITNVIDKFQKPTEAGFVGLQIFFKDPENGAIGEIFFNLCHVYKTMEVEGVHVLYEQLQEIERDLDGWQKAHPDKNPHDEIRRLQKEIKGLYKKAIESASEGIPCQLKSTYLIKEGAEAA